MKNAEWIADLVRHGLVRASFVPPPEVRALRDLVRHRKAVVGNLATERNRTLHLLESAGIKLAGVISDVLGVSGMLMLRALPWSKPAIVRPPPDGSGSSLHHHTSGLNT